MPIKAKKFDNTILLIFLALMSTLEILGYLYTKVLTSHI